MRRLYTSSLDIYVDKATLNDYVFENCHKASEHVRQQHRQITAEGQHGNKHSWDSSEYFQSISDKKHEIDQDFFFSVSAWNPSATCAAMFHVCNRCCREKKKNINMSICFKTGPGEYERLITCRKGDFCLDVMGIKTINDLGCHDLSLRSNHQHTRAISTLFKHLPPRDREEPGQIRLLDL